MGLCIAAKNRSWQCLLGPERFLGPEIFFAPRLYGKKHVPDSQSIPNIVDAVRYRPCQ